MRFTLSTPGSPKFGLPQPPHLPMACSSQILHWPLKLSFLPMYCGALLPSRAVVNTVKWLEATPSVAW